MFRKHRLESFFQRVFRSLRGVSETPCGAMEPALESLRALLEPSWSHLGSSHVHSFYPMVKCCDWPNQCIRPGMLWNCTFGQRSGRFKTSQSVENLILDVAGKISEIVLDPRGKLWRSFWAIVELPGSILNI